MQSLEKSRLNGFTLVELMVVIAIIGILVSLLVVGVQSARESARRMSCSNNLHQLGIALQNYESAYKVFPPSRLETKKPKYEHSWMSMIMPFIEQTNNGIRYNLRARWYDKVNDEFTTQTIPVLMCPSAPTSRKVPIPALYSALTEGRRSDQPKWGYTDYGSINAIRNSAFVLSGLPALREKEALGALGRGPDGVRPATVTDGLSQTVFIAEGGGKPTLYIAGKQASNPESDVAFGQGVVRDGWGWADINGGFSIDGATRQGIPNKTKKDGTVVGNGTCFMNCTNDSELYSFHNSGSQMLFGDGAVQFVSANINSATLVAMLTRDHGDDY